MEPYIFCFVYRIHRISFNWSALHLYSNGNRNNFFLCTLERRKTNKLWPFRDPPAPSVVLVTALLLAHHFCSVICSRPLAQHIQIMHTFQWTYPEADGSMFLSLFSLAIFCIASADCAAPWWCNGALVKMAIFEWLNALYTLEPHWVAGCVTVRVCEQVIHIFRKTLNKF